MIKPFVLLLFFFSAFFIHAASIKGGIKGFDNKTIQAFIYEDYITYKKQKLVETQIHSGQFELNFSLKNTRQVILQIGNKSTSLYVEPHNHYDISLEYDPTINEGRAFNKVLNLIFILPKPQELNTKIKDFNRDYQKFMAANYQKFAIKKADKDVADYMQKKQPLIQKESNVFAREYYRYALANLEDISYSSKEELYKKYLKDKPTLYHHKEFMNFWTQFYQNDFDQLTLSKKGLDIMRALSLDQDTRAAVQKIKIAKQISSDEQAELYLLQGLFEVYFIKRLDQEKIITLLNQIAEKAENEENEKIARNIIQNLKRNSPNKIVTNFKIWNPQNQAQQFYDFKGQLIYLNFWSMNSIPSLKEMQIIRKLQDKYGDQMHFVSISIDDASTFRSAIKDYKFDWNVFHINESLKVIEEFDLRTIPSYFLIDTKGKMIQAHTANPVEIEERIYKLLRN